MKTVSVPYRKPWFAGEGSGRAIFRNIISYLLHQKNYIVIPAAFLLGRADISGGLAPFGFAFFAAASGSVSSRLAIALSIAAGMLTHSSLEQVYVTAAGMLLLSVLSVPFAEVRQRMNFKYACLSFVCIMTPQFLLVCLQGFLLYDLLKALFCSMIAFLLFFVFKNAYSVITSTVKKHVHTNEEVISIVVMAAIAVAGLGDIHLLGFSPRSIISIIMILLFSYKCGPGVGTAAGASMGLIIGVSSGAMPATIGTYAFCGLLSGIFRSLGKTGSVLGFFMGNAILAIYLNGSSESLIVLKEIVISVILFFVLPRKLVDFISRPFRGEAGEVGQGRPYYHRVRDMAADRLRKFSNAFLELAKTFDEISQTRVTPEKHDISLLFDRVADRVCRNCSLNLHCWERNFYNTYQVMFRIVEVLDSKGRIDESDIPGYFLDRCERIKEFAEAVNNMYELFKVDMVWKGRVSESRGLLSQQFAGLSNAICSLADEISTDVDFLESLEEEIHSELVSAGIKVKEVTAFENRLGKYEVNVLHSGCGGARVCISGIEKIVSAAVGRRMTRESEDCRKAKDGSCFLRLVEEENLKITASVARLPRFDSDVSGDSFTFMNDGMGKYILALSDGMGSGYKASLQSRATVGMLENLLETGFDRDLAVKLINSVLLLRSGDDSFSTIDMSVVDLFTGEVEFVKIGAVPTYIKRQGIVDMVRSASLPAGILGGIDTELAHKGVESGDILIMLTDGVIDSFTGEEQGDRVLLKFIQEMKSTNPQQVADGILEEACRYCGDKPGDDMTVIAAKVWKKTRS